MLNIRSRLSIAGGGCAAALLVASCGPKSPTNVAQQPAPPAPAPTAPAPTAAPYELTVATTTTPEPGKPAELMLSLIDKATGAPPKLTVAHEKLLHLIVVRKDLGDFQHLHPDQQPDGKMTVQATFPTAGEYLVFADFTPEGAGQQVARQTITVAGDAPTAETLTPDADQPKADGDVQATLALQPAQLAPKAMSMLTFNLTNRKTGKPVADLKPYLGAMGHAVILSEDGQDFLHAHPAEHGAGHGESKEQHGDHGSHGGPSGGGGHGGHEGHGGHGSMSTEPASVMFHTEFPRAGLYKVWGQFNAGGNVRTVSFVVPVGTTP